MPNTLRWGDLVSPRAVYEFTLADAVASLPSLLAMAGLFVLSVLFLYIGKRILEWILLCGSRSPKYVKDRSYDVGVDGKRKRKQAQQWIRLPTHTWGSMAHLIIETLFFLGMGVIAVFVAALGGINLWQSQLAYAGIGIIVTYIFGMGLQTAGAGYFVAGTAIQCLGEWWELDGSPNIYGRVSVVTPFFVYLDRLHKEKGSTQTIRVNMVTVWNGNWIRSYADELHAEPAYSSIKPHTAIPILGEDEDETEEGMYEHNAEHLL